MVTSWRSAAGSETVGGVPEELSPLGPGPVLDPARRAVARRRVAGVDVLGVRGAEQAEDLRADAGKDVRERAGDVAGDLVGEAECDRGLLAVVDDAGSGARNWSTWPPSARKSPSQSRKTTSWWNGPMVSLMTSSSTRPNSASAVTLRRKIDLRFELIRFGCAFDAAREAHDEEVVVQPRALGLLAGQPDDEVALLDVGHRSAEQAENPAPTFSPIVEVVRRTPACGTIGAPAPLPTSPPLPLTA